MTTRPSQSVYRTIQFTAASTTEGQAAGGKLTVELGDLIAYEENTDFTRLTLTGGRVLHVKETAVEIERLVRQASGDCRAWPDWVFSLSERVVTGHDAFSTKETPAVNKPIDMTRRKPSIAAANSAPFARLEKGQNWKVGESYLQITDVGKRLVHYKKALTLQQRGLRKHVASIETVQTFLKSHRAELLASPDCLDSVWRKSSL
jgi:hypothetical protein